MGKELALGRNLKVAFTMEGITSRMRLLFLRRFVTFSPLFTLNSLEVRDTKLGERRVTNDIPNVSEEATRLR
jgi:DNA-directed RNA polymerase beta subunit